MQHLDENMQHPDETANHLEDTFATYIYIAIATYATTR
jgi:hypothetical protein